MWPVKKLAESEARKTAAPTSSSNRPKRFIGVRRRNSCPLGPSNNFAFKSVRNTPGAMAFTQTPWRAHSTAKDFVRDATALLLAEYAATSNSDTKDDRDAILIILPNCRSIILRPNT